MTTTAAEPLDTHGEMSGMAYKPAAPAASMRATHEPQLTTTRRVLIRGRPISNWLGMGNGSYIWPLLGLTTALFFLAPLVTWGVPAAVSSVCNMAGSGQYAGGRQYGQQYGGGGIGEDLLRRGQEYAKEAYENLPGARDVGRGMDYMREGWKDTSQMTGRTMGGGWLSGSWWPWNWSLWPWNWYRSYSDSSMYRSRAERVSEEAVWQAIERVADEMKRSAHSHGDTGMYGTVKDAAHVAYDAATYPARKAADIARGAYQGARMGGRMGAEL